MATYEQDFRRTAEDIIRRAAEGGDDTSIFVDEMAAAAAVYADEREADQPQPDGSESCTGPCCGGRLES